MNYAERERNPVRHLPSISMVIVFHLLLGYALVTGLARRVVEVIKAPIETKIIEEIKKPPPEVNIQVPQITQAPTITTTQERPPPGPVVIAPPTPPVQASPVRKEFKPLSRVNPTFPRQALQQGITGRVVAWVYVEPNGNVKNVEIKQSTNRLFDREVVRALSQWRFNPEPVGFIGEYEIVFNLTD